MTRRKEKWCVPGYQVSQRGRFSSSVALTPQFKNAVAMHLGQAFRSSLARPSRNECPFAGELGCGLRFEIGTVDLDPKLFWSPLDFPSPQRRTPWERVRLPPCKNVKGTGRSTDRRIAVTAAMLARAIPRSAVAVKSDDAVR